LFWHQRQLRGLPKLVEPDDPVADGKVDERNCNPAIRNVENEKLRQPALQDQELVAADDTDDTDLARGTT
jgi:hypothetical protein